MVRIQAAFALALGRLVGAELQSSSSPAVQYYDPNMAKAFAALCTLTYCASEFPRGVPTGLALAVERNCGTGDGSWCRPAGFAVVKGSVGFVNLRDLGQWDQNFAIVAGWERLANAHLRTVATERGCLVVQRGSIGDVKTGANWIRDFQTENVPPTGWPECTKCNVHRGYYAMWSAMESKLLKKLKQAGCSAAEKSAVYVAGHSLGGGMTYFIMYGLQRLGFSVQISYAFAAPMVGDAYFANAFVSLFNRSVPLFHIDHADDKTPVGPQGSIHTPFQVFYPDMSEKYVICDRPADAECGIHQYDPDHLKLAEGTLPMHSPHCLFPLAPYGTFCQFMGMPAINLFYSGPMGMLDFNKICVNSGMMSAKHDHQPKHSIVV